MTYTVLGIDDKSLVNPILLLRKLKLSVTAGLIDSCTFEFWQKTLVLTTQDGDGQWLYLSATTMRVLTHWQRTARLTRGALFRGIDSGNRLNERLSDKGVERAFKRIAEKLGFSARLFSGHSTRVGAAQEMVEANIDTAGILLAGRWSDTRMIARYAKKLNAKRSGSAALSEQLGTNRPDSVSTDATNSNPTAIGFLDEPGSP